MAWVQPVLTANGTIGQSEFAVASGGGAESDAYKAFDSSASSFCNKMNSGAWLSFYSKTWLVISDILITSDQCLPSQGIFQVSYDDGATWEQIGSWQDEEESGNSAHIVFSEGVATGNYFRFVSQGKSLAKPNSNADFCNVTITADEATTGTMIFFADVEREIKNSAQFLSTLKVWLPFDKSTTLDRCGGTWTATGNVSLSSDVKLFGAASVHLPNGAYLTANNVIDINADKWTFDAWAYLVSSSDDNGYFALSARTDAARYGIIDSNDGIYVAATDSGWQAKNTSTTFPSVKSQWVHLAVVKNGTRVTFYQNGTAVWSCTTSALDNSGAFILGGNYYGYNTDIYFDEVRFYEGVALWTSDFTPPTAADYEELAFQLDGGIVFTVDVERRISNRVEFTADVERKIINAWRYYNAGTADDLITSGTTLENLSDDKSVTGTAFYQTARAKCFDLPATDEVWLKFDVYFDGSNRWRAYNGGAAGTNGISSYGTTELDFLSNGKFVRETDRPLISNTLQTVLLHMISGATAGVIEAWVDGTKIHTYTGDVNHGEDFADIYLQSDGAGTFFSNVVISNKDLTFADGYQTFTADVECRLSNTFEFTADVERKVSNVIAFDFVADVEIIYFLPVTFAADVERRVTVRSEFAADVEIFDVIPVKFTADVIRAIKAKVKMFAVDSSEYFSGSSDSGTLNPVVIPPQETIPAAPDNTIGLQSIEISLSEQQITDNIAFVGVVPFDIMYPVKGQYLDYVFDMRVERVQQKGILYSCECCSDVDQLLYTQLAYTVPQSTDWHSSGESTDTVTNDDKSVSAKFHASSIARTLGKTAVIQFDDFASTVLTENLGGATYADLIRDVFGWSLRVPTQMINVFIRDDKIYFVQRGHEARLIDLSGTKHTIPTITHELVRMTWGSTPWSKTTNLESKKYMPSTSKGSSTGGTSGGSGDDPTGGTSGGSAGGNAEIADIEKNGGQVMVASDSWNGYPESGHVTYTYNRDGLLIQTYTYVYNQETNQSTHTTVDHAYDADGTVIYTKTFVQSMTGIGTDGDSSSQTEEYKGYIILPNGEKFLARESTIRRVGENTLTPTELVEAKTIIHTPTRAGQGHTTVISDGEDIGGVVGQNTGDDRVTPFARYKAGSLIDSSRTADASGSYDALNDIDSSGAYQYNPETGKWEKVSNDTDLLPQTLNGLSLYDSSFPIHNVGKLVELTNAIKWLNRRTKETVTMTIYEYPHLIDFNDRIIFNGSEYFLVSNVATTNARIFNEQRVTFTRWY